MRREIYIHSKVKALRRHLKKVISVLRESPPVSFWNRWTPYLCHASTCFRFLWACFSICWGYLKESKQSIYSLQGEEFWFLTFWQHKSTIPFSSSFSILLKFHFAFPNGRYVEISLNKIILMADLVVALIWYFKWITPIKLSICVMIILLFDHYLKHVECYHSVAVPTSSRVAFKLWLHDTFDHIWTFNIYVFKVRIQIWMQCTNVIKCA